MQGPLHIFQRQVHIHPAGDTKMPNYSMFLLANIDSSPPSISLTPLDKMFWRIQYSQLPNEPLLFLPATPGYCPSLLVQYIAIENVPVLRQHYATAPNGIGSSL